MPGYTMITPYENATGGDPRYLHFYEMDTDEPELAFKSMTPLVEELIGRQGTPEFDALGLARCPAHHVRQHVQTPRRAHRVTGGVTA